MGEQVNVRTLEALEGLAADFRGFAEKTASNLAAVEGAIQHTLEELDERCLRWQRAVERCEDDYEDARSALADCQAAGNGDDCDDEDEQLRAAGCRLDEANERLDRARRSVAAVERAAQDYRRRARELHRLATTRTAQASEFLLARLRELQQYAAGGAAASPGAAGPAGGLQPAAGGPGAGGGASAQGRGAAGIISGFDRSGVMSDNDVAAHLSRVPMSHLEGLAAVRYTGEWHPNAEGDGYVAGEYDPSDRSVSIHAQSPGGSHDRDDLEDTLLHEAAHHVWARRMSPAQRSEWRGVSRGSGPREYVTGYATQDELEDLTESYAYYIDYPELLQARSPGKYAFMKRLFRGREYV